MSSRSWMIIHLFRPVCGGAELQAERLAKKLVALGHRVKVITSRQPDTCQEETCDGVDIYRAPFRLPFRLDIGDYLDTFRYLVRNRRHYDILHCHQAFGHAVVATLVARWFGKRSLIKFCCAGHYGDLSVLSQFRMAPWALNVLRQADGFVAVSHEMREELIAWGFPPQRIHLMPNSVDCQLFSRQRSFPPTPPTRFILVGRRQPQKGVDLALQAARILADTGLAERFRLDLYGRDYPECDYQFMAKEMGLSGLVHFHNFTDKILDVMQSCHCFILPSRGEGLSNSLLEAMSLEMPVIATRVSGCQDVITSGEDGILIDQDSSKQLAEAMQTIIEKPSWGAEIGRQARLRMLSDFSLDVLSRRYSQLYDELSR